MLKIDGRMMNLYILVIIKPGSLNIREKLILRLTKNNSIVTGLFLGSTAARRERVDQTNLNIFELLIAILLGFKDY